MKCLLGDDEVERFDIAGSGASSTDARPLGWIDDVPGDDVPGDDVPNHDRATSAIDVGLLGVFEARSFSSECVPHLVHSLYRRVGIFP